MVAQIIVIAREGALGALFVGQNDSDWRVVAVEGGDARDRHRVFAGEVIIIVPLLSDFGAVGASGKRIDRPIFLHEAGIGPSAISERPIIVILAASPGEA